MNKTAFNNLIISRRYWLIYHHWSVPHEWWLRLEVWWFTLLFDLKISTQCNVTGWTVWYNDFVSLKTIFCFLNFFQYLENLNENCLLSYTPTCPARNAGTGILESSPLLLCTLSDLTEGRMREQWNLKKRRYKCSFNWFEKQNISLL